MRKFTKMEVATIKRTAQNVANFVAQKEKLAKKMEELKVQYDAVSESLKVWEAPIMKLTGGYTTEDLVNKVVIPSVNKEGKTVNMVKYELKYPETVVPVDMLDGTVGNLDEIFPVEVVNKETDYQEEPIA